MSQARVAVQHQPLRAACVRTKRKSSNCLFLLIKSKSRGNASARERKESWRCEIDGAKTRECDPVLTTVTDNCHRGVDLRNRLTAAVANCPTALDPVTVGASAISMFWVDDGAGTQLGRYPMCVRTEKV